MPVTIAPGDILYNNVSSNPLCVMIKRVSDGMRWDFVAKTWAAVPASPTPFPASMALNLTPDPRFPGEQTAVIPGAVTTEPTACLVEAIQSPAGTPPAPTQCYWIARGAAVLMQLPRGATGTFMG